jgi:hypothetical protein
VIDDAALLARIRLRAHEENPDLPAPASAATIRRAEAAAGLRLHPLLAAAYREIADGGFGPDYQLMPLLSGGRSKAETVIGGYRARRVKQAGSNWAWPEGVLPILHWGCAMYACVDCRSQAGTVLLFEPNIDDPDRAWYVDTASLAEWFAHHLDGTGWWVRAAAGEDPWDLMPWPQARSRA